MDSALQAARTHRPLVVSVIAACAAIVLFCLVGIALMLGWIAIPGAQGITPASIASPAQQVTGTLPALDANESIVPPPENISPAPAAAPPPANISPSTKAGPTTPHYVHRPPRG
jgi:hypothetical protein